MGSKHKKKHRSKRRSSTEADRSTQSLLGHPDRLVAKLLKWACKGKAKKLNTILSACQAVADATALTAVQDVQGRTLLHLASQAGHDEAVEVLLKYGANTEAHDNAGNTPTHLAAAAGHCTTLQLLLTCDRPPDIHTRNQNGITIEQLVLQALGEQHVQHESASMSDSKSPTRSGSHTGARGTKRKHADETADDEAAWRKRLAEEASDDEWGAGLMPHYGDEQDGVGYPEASRTGVYDAAEQEDDDAWADRLWTEMHARRQAAARAAARSFASSFREAQAARAAQREREHAVRMERLKAAAELLREAQAQDARWRQHALQQGAAAIPLPPLDPTQARTQYEARWAQMEQQLQSNVQPAASGTGTSVPSRADKAGAAIRIGFADVAWPLPEGYDYTLDFIRDVLLAGVQGPADVKRRLRAELMRWHPDKFTARWTGLLAVADADRITARVKLISQALTALMT